MNPTAILKSGSILENRYKVVRLMVQGGATFVYEGHHVGLRFPLVIKQLKELYPDPIQAKEQVAQFQDQAKLLAKLRHPALVQVYDTFQVEGLPVLVAEMIRGKNLQQIVDLAPRLISQKRVLIWARQLLDALDFLHCHDPPIIVRGLQPRNIILDSTRQLRLIDFGLSKSMDDKGAGTRNIVRGLGEDGFAPLEQGAYSKTDCRSDLYSLGATLYFLLTKMVPPSASQRVISKKDPLADPRQYNPTVTDETWSALRALMQLRPCDRPISAAEAKILLLSQPLEPESKRTRLCVDCSTPLSVEIHDGVEIDRCCSCGGLWLDNGELETLTERANQEQQQVEELVRTIALSPDHPALKMIEEQKETGSQLWLSLARMLGFKQP